MKGWGKSVITEIIIAHRRGRSKKPGVRTLKH